MAERACLDWVRMLDEAKDKYREKSASALMAQSLTGGSAQDSFQGMPLGKELGEGRGSSNAPGTFRRPGLYAAIFFFFLS